VVVDNARKMISKTIDIVVTSVLQTNGGEDDLREVHRRGDRPAGGAGAVPGSGAERRIGRRADSAQQT